MKTMAMLGTVLALASACRDSDAQVSPNRGAPPHHEPARNPAPLHNHDEQAGDDRTDGRDLENLRDAGR